MPHLPENTGTRLQFSDCIIPRLEFLDHQNYHIPWWKMFLFFHRWMLKVQKQCKGDALWVCASILTFDEHFRMLIMYQVVFVFSGFLTKYHRLGNLTEINFLTFSEGWKSEIRVLAFCGKDFLPDLGMAAFKLSGLPSYNILIPLWCFPHQWPHLNLISSPKSLFKYHHTVQAMGGGDTIQSLAQELHQSQRIQG